MRPRRWGRLAALGLAVLALLGIPASALPHPLRVGGIVPDVPSGATAAPLIHAVLARATDVSDQGGAVLHSNRTHLVFWEPAGSGLAFDPGYQSVMERFLTRVAADSHDPGTVYGLTGQYGDGSGPAANVSSYGGAVLDTDALPVSGCSEPATGPAGWRVCLTDGQLEQELGHLVSSHHLPRTGSDIYFLVLPDGLGSCLDGSPEDGCALGGAGAGYCGYHGETGSGLLYAVIPYNAVAGHCQSDNPRPNASPADPALSTVSHEQMEAITDPDPGFSWVEGYVTEIGDLCLTQFGPAIGGSGDTAFNESIAGGHYWLQEEWSNENGGCAARVDPNPVSLTAPSRGATGRTLALSARASDPHGRILAYAWWFGDGASSTRRAVRHSFARAGTYRVVLRVTDSADNWTYATRTVRVLGAAAQLRRRTTRGRA